MKFILFFTACTLLNIPAYSAEGEIAVSRELVDFVDPFIGTGGHGHTFPGSTMPFGMVQLSPDTRLEGWDGCSGYHYTDQTIYGFSHTHLSGTGVSDYGDILIMPTKGHIDPSEIGTTQTRYDHYKSDFKKSTERASPGYYSVFLDRSKIYAQLTSTLRTGFHRYKINEAGEYSVVIDLIHRDKLIKWHLEMVDNNTIRGYRVSESWAREQHVYFYAVCSQSFETGLANEDKNIMALHFDLEKGDTLDWKVAISAVSMDGAKNNMLTEAAHWDFQKYLAEARYSWESELSKIQVDGGSEDDKIKFYTALYHTMIAPNVYSDVDGQFRGTDLKIHQGDPDQPQFTVFSLWDTFRATHPLFTITQPTRTKYFLSTFLRQYRDGGKLPVWELAANYTGCMIGYHSASVIADAAAKGFISKHQMSMYLEAMLKSANSHELGLDSYNKYGYIPSDHEHESVSKTLEYAYDDWCIAQCAKFAEKDSIYHVFIKRAQHYKNIFNGQTGFFQPKINGNWKSNFDPTEVNFNYTEANGWQYNHFVPHDISGLINAHGGKQQLSKQLDELFQTSATTSGRKQADITGLIGQYAHGNEPSHHVAFMYYYLNQPHKTHKIVNQIMDSLYTIKPDGLSGNEDCGQMSAWYVMAAMGLYQMSPGNNEYIIMPSKFKRVQVRNEKGQYFSLLNDQQGVHVKSVKVNNKLYPFSYISHQTIFGKTIHFGMDDKSHFWGESNDYVPSTQIDAQHHILTTPLIVHEGSSFHKKTKIRLEHEREDVDLVYWKDGKEKHYRKPIKLKKTSQIKVQAVTSDLSLKSAIEEASFFKKTGKTLVKIATPYDNQYNAGGDQALVDGIKGSKDFRTGAWQGYYGKDVKLEIDLKKAKRVNTISVGCLQDIKSWIWFPRSIKISVSKNGDEWTEIDQTCDRDKDMIYGSFRSEYQFIIAKLKIRYIKVEVVNYGPNPEGHLGAGEATWLFLDEIDIK